MFAKFLKSGNAKKNSLSPESLNRIQEYLKKLAKEKSGDLIDIINAAIENTPKKQRPTSIAKQDIKLATITPTIINEKITLQYAITTTQTYQDKIELAQQQLLALLAKLTEQEEQEKKSVEVITTDPSPINPTNENSLNTEDLNKIEKLLKKLAIDKSKTLIDIINVAIKNGPNAQRQILTLEGNIIIATIITTISEKQMTLKYAITTDKGTYRDTINLIENQLSALLALTEQEEQEKKSQEEDTSTKDQSIDKRPFAETTNSPVVVAHNQPEQPLSSEKNTTTVLSFPSSSTHEVVSISQSSLLHPSSTDINKKMPDSLETTNNLPTPMASTEVPPKTTTTDNSQLPDQATTISSPLSSSAISSPLNPEEGDKEKDKHSPSLSPRVDSNDNMTLPIPTVISTDPDSINSTHEDQQHDQVQTAIPLSSSPATSSVLIQGSNEQVEPLLLDPHSDSQTANSLSNDASLDREENNNSPSLLPTGDSNDNMTLPIPTVISTDPDSINSTHEDQQPDQVQTAIPSYSSPATSSVLIQGSKEQVDSSDNNNHLFEQTDISSSSSPVISSSHNQDGKEPIEPLQLDSNPYSQTVNSSQNDEFFNGKANNDSHSPLPIIDNSNPNNTVLITTVISTDPDSINLTHEDQQPDQVQTAIPSSSAISSPLNPEDKELVEPLQLDSNSDSHTVNPSSNDNPVNKEENNHPALPLSRVNSSDNVTLPISGFISTDPDSINSTHEDQQPDQVQTAIPSSSAISSPLNPEDKELVEPLQLDPNSDSHTVNPSSNDNPVNKEENNHPPLPLSRVNSSDNVTLPIIAVIPTHPAPINPTHEDHQPNQATISSSSSSAISSPLNPEDKELGEQQDDQQTANLHLPPTTAMPYTSSTTTTNHLQTDETYLLVSKEVNTCVADYAEHCGWTKNRNGFLGRMAPSLLRAYTEPMRALEEFNKTTCSINNNNDPSSYYSKLAGILAQQSQNVVNTYFHQLTFKNYYRLAELLFILVQAGKIQDLNTANQINQAFARLHLLALLAEPNHLNNKSVLAQLRSSSEDLLPSANFSISKSYYTQPSIPESLRTTLHQDSFLKNCNQVLAEQMANLTQDKQFQTYFSTHKNIFSCCRP